MTSKDSSFRSRDPLYRDTALSHECTLPVFGIPTRFRSDSAAVLSVVDDAFGAWRVLDHEPGLVSDAPATVTLALHTGDEGRHEHAPIRFRSLDGRRMLVATPGSQAVVEPLRRDALGWVTRDLVEDRNHFRYGFLEALTLSLLSSLGRPPLHAAALYRDGAALLLVGPTGVGKSTLTYAAARAGIPVLAEDSVRLQLDPELRVWGMPGFLHLLQDARDLFPELSERVPALQANGKRKIAVDLRALGAVAPRPFADRIGVCVLRRSASRPASIVQQLGTDELRRALDPSAELGFDIYRPEISALLRRLDGLPAWTLVTGSDPAAAVAPLRRMLRQL